MRRYNLRLSILSLSTLVVASIYTPQRSDAWDTSAFGSMGDVDWAKRSYYGGPDAFSSMGDVDWSKRSAVGAALRFGIDGEPGLSKDKRSRGLYRSWLSRGNSPGYQYHSMADTDWGWKKRAELTNEDDHERPISLYQNYLKKKARGGYKHRPYYGYRSRHTSPYFSTRRASPFASASRSRSIKRPQNYNYHSSMADMDWGWKRKKKSGDDLLGDPEEPLDKETLTDQEVNDLMELLYEENANNGDNFDVSKRNIGSFLRQNNDKRTLASIAKDDDSVEEEKKNWVPPAAGKRSSVDDTQEINDLNEAAAAASNDLQMEKRNIASVAREFHGSYRPRSGRLRRGGVSSLARNGGIRNKIMNKWKQAY